MMMPLILWVHHETLAWISEQGHIYPVVQWEKAHTGLKVVKDRIDYFFVNMF